MDPPENPFPARRENQLQGPRPAPLRVNKESHKIRKPPIVPKPALHAPPQYTHAPPQYSHAPPQAANKPVVIYSVSPKPIYADASDFKSIVQRLTGFDPSPVPDYFPDAGGAPANFTSSGEAPPSPAARLAATERTSPSERERRRSDIGDEFLMVAGGGNFSDVGQAPGILSPAPANLPTMSAATVGLFSPAPAVEGQGMFGLSDWATSPLMGGYGMGGINFSSSPSALFFSTTAIGSPYFSPGGDIFKLFDS